MRVLVFNPGSNSLKFQVIDARPDTWGRKEIVGAFEPIESFPQPGGLILQGPVLFEGGVAQRRFIDDDDPIPPAGPSSRRRPGGALGRWSLARAFHGKMVAESGAATRFHRSAASRIPAALSRVS